MIFTLVHKRIVTDSQIAAIRSAFIDMQHVRGSTSIKNIAAFSGVGVDYSESEEEGGPVREEEKLKR